MLIKCTERWEVNNTADCSFIIWHLGLQTFSKRYRRLTVTRSYQALQLKGPQAEMKTDKDTISCIQMIMWYFINPHRENLFLSATLHREDRGRAQLLEQLGIRCLAQGHISRVEGCQVLGHLASLSPLAVSLWVLGGGAGHLWSADFEILKVFFDETIPQNSQWGQSKLIPFLYKLQS